MNVNKLVINANGYPSSLGQLHKPPEQLFVAGDFEAIFGRPMVGVVGSRKVSAYGQQVTVQLAGDLARQGVVIISGLALGVDALAHKAALDAGGPTVAVLPGSIENIYPRSHYALAQRIVQSGGVLLSEYGAGSAIYKQNFIARNRIIAALSHALLITEAAEKSGSLHTARFALEQGKDVLAVPGNITSATSAGTNNLLKAGATPATAAEDVLHILGIEPAGSTSRHIRGANDTEQLILSLLSSGVADGEELLVKSELGVDTFNQTLTMLEITGKVRALGANQWGINV